ncbi:non-ribosomal peptide synthetase [Paracoccus sp. Ld10]|uniref:non-ribosomal peptide synthetase n=1 Tax=Paracoccus sp. Ld10 TaxID=649158 RepID=UPI00386CE9EE
MLHAPSVSADDRDGFCSLPAATDSQAAFLAASDQVGSTGAYIEQIVVDGPSTLLEPQALRDAWQQVAMRHETLRTLLVTDTTGILRLCVLDRAEVRIDPADLSDAVLDRFLTADRTAGVDTADRPGWRVTYGDLGGGQSRMVLTIHHALIDGAGIALLLTDLWRILSGNAPEAPAHSFVQTIRDRGLDEPQARAAFAAALSDDTVAAAFPAAPAKNHGQMGQTDLTLSIAASDAIRHLARSATVTTLTVVQAAWATLLMRWTGRPGAAFGLVESGRGHAEDVAGCLIATVPFQVRLDDVATLGDLLNRLRALTLELRPHAHARQTMIRQWSGRKGRAALYDTVVMYQHGTLATRLAANGCGWTGVRLIEQGTALMSLSVHDEAALRISLEYSIARLPEDMGDRILQQVAALLQAMGQADTDTPLSGLTMLDAVEQDRLLAMGRPERPVPNDVADLASAFEATAARHGSRPAVTEAQTGLSVDFTTLDHQANALAARLVGCAIGPGDVVAIALPRSVRQIAAMLATLKIGAAFLLLDLEQSPDYLSGLIRQARVRAIVAPEDTPLSASVPNVLLADDACQAHAPPRPALNANTLAYVTFTSGSTGTPKAVRGLNAALSAHAHAIADAYALAERDVVLQFATPSFDVALEEIWPTLLSGAHVVLRDASPLGSIQGLLDLVTRHDLTVLNLPASYWQQMVADLRDHPRPLPPSLRLLVTGSERVPPAACREWLRLAPTVRFVNAYGPAETTVTSTLWTGNSLPEGSEVPIGRPAGHARIHLRAPDGTPTPLGGEGEIVIGGRAVSGGYLDDPQSTAQAFLPDPDIAQGRLYRSGDLGRWSADGQLMFLGREDRQVKLRGQRIELGQIENALASQPGVVQFYVDLDKGPPPRLLGWVVTEDGTDVARITRNLRDLLPAYMVPRLIAVTDLPVTTNGKIARDLLPKPAAAGPLATAAQAEPQVLAVADCMANVLELPHVGPDDDFYDLGGDSLLALRLISLVRTRTGLRLHTADVMQAPTPEGLVRLQRTTPDRPRYLISTQPMGSRVPIIGVHVLGRRQALFRPLSDALGPDFPVLGLTVGVPEDGLEIQVEAVARTYLEELDRHLPGQPVCLVAVSMASYFALELAQQLRRAGRDVPLLVVLDAAGPGGRPSVRGWARLRAHLGQLRRHGLRHIVDTLHNRRPHDQPEQRDLLPSDVDGPTIDMAQLIEANVRAVVHYHPQPYDSPVAIFRADASFWDSPEGLRQGLGWAPIAAGGWTLHDLPGTHLSILEPGNVDVLAGHLRALLPPGPTAPPVKEP